MKKVNRNHYSANQDIDPELDPTIEPEFLNPMPIPMDWVNSGIDFETREIELCTSFSFEQISHLIRAFRRMIAISREPVTIFISSYGGDLCALLSFYDWILFAKRHGVVINTIASGTIQSAGAFLFLSGTNRLATKNTRIMIHTLFNNQSFGTPQSGRALLAEANENERILIDILAKNTKRDRKYWLNEFKNGDLYFNTNEALKLGIVHKILK